MTQSTDHQSPLLKERDVAAMLNIKVVTLRRWRWQGVGPRFLKLGSAVRYDSSDVESFIARGRRHSTSDLGEPWR